MPRKKGGKKPGDQITLKLKDNEELQIVDWINAQTVFIDSLRILIRNDIKNNNRIINYGDSKERERHLNHLLNISSPQNANNNRLVEYKKNIALEEKLMISKINTQLLDLTVKLNNDPNVDITLVINEILKVVNNLNNSFINNE